MQRDAALPRTRLFAAIRAFLVVLVASACHDQGPTGPARHDLDAAEQKWNAQGRTAYSLEQQRDCFCVSAGRLYRLVVIANQVQSVIDITTGQAVPDDQRQLFRTVTQLFTEVRNALATAGARVDVTYDPETGIPSRVWIDPNPNTADEEYGYRSGNIHTLID